ncbi:bile acid:sodium symporter family protein (plasmid) [Sphingobium sp. V4]|nr:bile acid:sodium symporter family protein [Sphingobium sp. V4]WIW90510.1 bile acid:sodium symporter family protein [Sphingobium sp. V4]
MMKLLRALDPYITTLLATVALAALLPAQGVAAVAIDGAGEAAIFLLFFLHGSKLSRDAIWAGIGHWRLHLLVLGSTYVLFPLMGLGVAAVPRVASEIAMGLLFLTLLPSTVQSSIAFTAMARGNVAAAVCSASISNLLGIFLTPLLVGLLIGQVGADSSHAAIQKIALQLLLPFVAGHLARPVIGGFVTRHKAVLGYVDRGSILLIVYAAFSAAVVEGLWGKVTLPTIAAMMALCAIMLAIALSATWHLGRYAGLERQDLVVLLFCGSKKSLASGVPMAGLLFPPAMLGPILLPLMIFHQIQLIACSFIAQRLNRDESSATPVSMALTQSGR